MVFAFAASPQGGGKPRSTDASGERDFLLHIAKNSATNDCGTSRVTPDRLLDRIAEPRNLAVALRNVARNKGAPGVDGRSVDEVVAASPRLLWSLRRRLLDGSYRPGDIRRVWIPKPGGGERGLGIPNVVDRWVQQAVLRIGDSSRGF